MRDVVPCYYKVVDALSSLKATTMGLSALFLWALSSLVISELKGIPTFQLSGTVFAIAFLYTSLQLTYKREWARINPSVVVLVVGFTALLNNQAAYVYSIKLIPPEQTEIIYYLWPILAVIVSAIFLEKSSFPPPFRFTSLYVNYLLTKLAPLVSTLLGLGGIYFLLAEGEELTKISLDRFEGYFFALIAAAGMVLYSLFNRYNRDIPLEMNGIWCGMSAIPCFLIHYCCEEVVVPSFYEWLLMSFIGIAILSYSLKLWAVGMRHGHFNTLNVLSYLTPLLSVLLLMAVGKTAFKNEILLACELVIAGGILCMLVEWIKQPQ